METYLGLLMVVGTCCACCGMYFSIQSNYRPASLCYAGSSLVMFLCNFIR